MIHDSSGVFFYSARRTLLVASAWCLALLTVMDCKGSTLTWTGSGGPNNANWTSSTNWGLVGIPGNGDTLIFQGTIGLKSTNNISNLTLNQIRFLGGGFNVYGNGFILTNSLVCTNFSGSINIYNSFTNGTGNLLILTSNGVTLTLYGNLAGTQGVTKSGLGTLLYQCAGNNTYTGTTLVAAGTLQLNCSGFNAISGPLVIGDGTGANSPTVQYLQDDEMQLLPSVVINLNGTLNLNNENEEYFTTNLTLSGGTIETGGGTVTLSPNTTINMPNNLGNQITGNLNTGSGTLTMLGFDLLSIYANVSGLANIAINGDIYTIWYGNNTYSGNVTNNGILPFDLASSTALGNINNTLTLNGSSFVILEGSVNLVNQTVTFNNTNIYNSEYGSIYAYAGNSSWQANFVLDGNCVANVATNYTLNLNGPISGPGGVTDIGPGALIYSGSTANTYSGLTTVDLGELDLAKSGGLAIAPFHAGIVIGDGTNVATVVYKGNYQLNSIVTPVVVNYNASLNLNGYSDTVSPLTLNSGVVNTAGGQLGLYQVYDTGYSTINGTIVPTPLTVSNNGDLTINANIVPYGAYGLTSTGLGSLILTASNSFTGPTVVQQGFVVLQNSWALGTTNSPVVVSNTATLELGGGVFVTNKPLVLNGPGALSDFGALDVESGVNVWAGPITNNANSTLDAWTSGSELHINGSISGPGGLECFGVAFGGSTHFFEGPASNSYAGLTTVDAGSTLELAKPLGVTSVPGNVVVNGELSLGSSLQLTPTADVLVNGGGLFAFGTNYDYFNTLDGYGGVNFGTNGFLIIGAAGGSSEFDGSVSGTGYPGSYTIYKWGTGTFALTGTNTYLNETVVAEGVLIVDGQQLQSPVIVGTSGILTGSGVVGSITSSGTVAPGNGGPALLTCSNLTFTSSGSYQVDMTGPVPGSGYAQLNPISPTPSNILGNATLQVVPHFTSPVSIGQQFTIISNATAHPFNGIFAGLPEGAQFTASGYTFRISYVGGTGNDVALTLAGVPNKTVTLNAVTCGWYDSTGFHTNNNMNYLAGGYGTGPSYRDFFVFNAPVSTNAVVHAELLVNDYTVLNPGNSDTFLLRKVATPIPTLIASWTGQTPIFNDLGTGAVYAVRSMATNESAQVAIIPLNAQFINDITAASGGLIALGGSVANLVPANPAPQYVFGASAGVGSDVRLRLVYGTNQVITSASHGWYDSSGIHNAGSPNYAAGYSDGDTFRDYFMFNLTNIPGQLVNAQLLVNAYGVGSTNSALTFQLYDVTNAITQLTNNQSSATGIFADLGSGMIYGGRDMYTNESYQTAAIPLDDGFLAAAQAANGGPIALGGAVTSITGSSANQDVFGFSSSSSPSDAQLWLGCYTRPVQHPTFSGAPQNLGGGLCQFHLAGTVGITNEIQGSFDFQRWDYITDVPMPDGHGTFIATNNSLVPYRFYRAEPLQ